MGGRDSTKRRLIFDEINWLRQVSDDRLRQYELMLSSGGAGVRRDGQTPRTEVTRERFASSLRAERERRARGE